MGTASDQISPSTYRGAVLALAIVSATSTALMLFARYVGAGTYVKGFTLIASSAYVLAGVVAGGTKSWPGRFTLVGLAFCWIGDVVGPGNFVAGLYAFLFGHIAFSASFLARGVEWKRVFVGVLPVLLTTSATGLILWPHVSQAEHPPFVFYSVVISTMLVLAGGVSKRDRVAFIAALVFYVSDILVARWRYAHSSIDGYLCYMLYYSSCLLFAYCARPSSAPEVSQPGTGRSVAA